MTSVQAELVLLAVGQPPHGHRAGAASRSPMITANRAPARSAVRSCASSGRAPNAVGRSARPRGARAATCDGAGPPGSPTPTTKHPGAVPRWRHALLLAARASTRSNPMPKPTPGTGGPPSASASPSYRPPPNERRLGRRERAADELERRARVVVEAPDQRGREPAPRLRASSPTSTASKCARHGSHRWSTIAAPRRTRPGRLRPCSRGPGAGCLGTVSVFVGSRSRVRRR